MPRIQSGDQRQSCRLGRDGTSKRTRNATLASISRSLTQESTPKGQEVEACSPFEISKTETEKSNYTLNLPPECVREGSFEEER